MVSGATVKVLLLADTHLGFDLPFAPRVERRRRGPDFFANMERALQPAYRGEVDLVVHGGDLLYRSRVPPELVQMAMAPLFRAAEAGVPVCLVPGNHERSQIPYPLLARHPKLLIFDGPRTFLVRRRGCALALSGWPYRPRMAGAFGRLLEQTGWRRAPADLRLLCLHQVVQGARVGVQDYCFRGGPEVIRGVDLPRGFAALLCGHIHRAQVLTVDLRGRPLSVPVLYPGAIERTSFAERDEPKGYLTLELAPEGEGGALARWTFHPLPTRPMVLLQGAPPRPLEWLRQRLAELPPDAIVRLRLPPEQARGLRAAQIRALAPSSMNVSLDPWLSGRAIRGRAGPHPR
jgi:exonuclease SbcD